MAKETESEKMVKVSNLHYLRASEAKVTKNEPHLRITKQRRLLFSSSGGLDYSGLLRGGGYVSFELKETEKDGLPIHNIRQSQIDTMEKDEFMGGNTFLLVYFKATKEWYRIDLPDLENAFAYGCSTIPRKYFMAFGYVVPAPNKFPEYLSPESHPQRNSLIQSYPSWMPKVRAKKKVEQMPKINHLDADARRQRIMDAIKRGTKNAERKEIEIKEIIRQKRDRDQ